MKLIIHIFSSSENGTDNRPGASESNGDSSLSKKDIDHEIPLNNVIVEENMDASENNGDYTTSNKSGNKRRSRTKSPSSRKRSKSREKGERKRRSRYQSSFRTY